MFYSDLRYATRLLLKDPGFALAAILTPGAVPLVEGVQENGRAMAQFDVASDGTCIFLSEAAVQRTLGWVNRTGQMTPLTQGNDRCGYPRLSPDGRFVAFATGDAPLDTWIYTSSEPRRLIFPGESGQVDYAAHVTFRICRLSNSLGLRYPSDECSRYGL